MFCRYCGAALPEDSGYCPKCGRAVNPYNMEIAQQQLPMKWYNFLIYFSLIVGAIEDVFYGILYVTGLIQPLREALGTPNVSLSNDVRVFEIVYGIILFALAYLCLNSRKKLAGFRADAPRQYIMLTISGSAISVVVYIISAFFQETFAGPYYFQLNLIFVIFYAAAEAIIVYLNSIYFKKRAHLFVN